MKPWIYEGEEIYSIEQVPDGAVGFIYFVKNIYGYWYVGKKNLYSTVTKPPLKGQKRKRKFVNESNWLAYKSSNGSVKEWEDWEYESRIIINWAFTKKHLTYLETHALFNLNVLKDKNSLNSNILGKFYPGDIPDNDKS